MVRSSEEPRGSQKSFIVNLVGDFAFILGVIYESAHTRDLGEIDRLGVVVPIYGGIQLFSGLASLGSPGRNGFSGVFLLLCGAWPVFTIITALATLGLLFTGAYLLWMI